MKKIFVSLIGIALLLTVLGTAQADYQLVTSLGDLGANDYVDWGQFREQTPVPSGTTFFTTQGLTGTVVSGAYRFNEGNGYFGGYPHGEELLFSGSGMTIQFASPITAIGTYIFDNVHQGWIGTIVAQGAEGNTLAQFSVKGGSNSASLGPAVFIGIISDTQDICRLIYSMRLDGFPTAPPLYVAINSLNIYRTTSAPSSVSLPASLLLFGPGLLGLVAAKRRLKR